MDYYNEWDAKTAAWLRELIAAGHLPKGHVDTRSIVDVKASDLKGYRQCHFFAGIGGWPYALGLAGWEGECWTGSCPCQPWSAAGQGAGEDDPRHLWPAWFRLVEQCRPAVVFGEQVASKLALRWLDLVFDDLEGAGYACGAADLGAAGVGAPHIRQRLYWLADARYGDEHHGRQVGRTSSSLCGETRKQRFRSNARHGSDADRLADAALGGQRTDRSASRRSRHAELCKQDGSMADTERAEWGQVVRGDVQHGPDARRDQASGGTGACREDGGLANADGGQSCDGAVQRSREHGQQPQDGRACWLGNAECTEGERQRQHGREVVSEHEEPDRHNATNPWEQGRSLLCSDQRVRQVPTELSLFPLVDGVQPARVVCLRGAGNAIVPQVGAQFVKAYMETKRG